MSQKSHHWYMGGPWFKPRLSGFSICTYHFTGTGSLTACFLMLPAPSTYYALNRCFSNRRMFSLKCDVPVLFTGSSHQKMRQGWGQLLGLVSSQAVRYDLLFSKIPWRLFPFLTPVLPLPSSVHPFFTDAWVAGGRGWSGFKEVNSGRSFSDQICPHIQVSHSSDVCLSQRPWQGHCVCRSVSWISSQGPTSCLAQEMCGLHWLMLYSFNVLHKKLSLGTRLQFLLSN